MKHYRPLAWMMTIAIAGTTVTACNSDDNELEKPFTTDPVEKATLYVCGISESGTRSISEAEDALFTEDDIEWFDINTRELRFHNMEQTLLEKLCLFFGVEFHLGDQTLFSGTTLFPGCTFGLIRNDLVLCWGQTDGSVVVVGDVHYYLYDCYPPQFINDERVQANRAKRAEQWENFIYHLESKGKLRK